MVGWACRSVLRAHAVGFFPVSAIYTMAEKAADVPLAAGKGNAAAAIPEGDRHGL
ncbi:hypothetical protein ACTMU2_40540 [Cupriavidus basilensis]